MELVTQGTLSDAGEDYSFTYEESELTGLEGTTTTVYIGKDQIVLKREGTLTTEMIFQVGQKHLSLYQTPFGGIMLGVNTRKAFSDIGQHGGRLSIHYTMEVENERVGENTFEIFVSEPTSASLPLQQ